MNETKSILRKAEQETAYLKAGILGFAGSGKTHTAMLIALGLMERIKSKKPLAFLDTETGSDFWIPRARAKGVEILRAKSRAFQDLLAVVEEAERMCDVLIIDSVSHIWKNFLESYMKRLNRTRLQFQDWNIIKPEWGKFTDLYLNSKLHIILCGRAGWEYDHYTDEDTGKKELIKTGTKMKAESEMGYEPSLLLEMERVRPGDIFMQELMSATTKQEKEIVRTGEGKKIGGDLIHRCHVVKDRSDSIDGQHFDNPTFACFLPVIETLTLGGQHIGIDTSRSSEEVFDEAGRTEQYRKEQRRKVLLEEIEATLVAKYPSTTGADKKAKIELCETTFGSASWTKISSLPIAELEQGLASLKCKPFVEPTPEEIQAGGQETFGGELPDPPGGGRDGREPLAKPIPLCPTLPVKPLEALRKEMDSLLETQGITRGVFISACVGKFKHVQGDWDISEWGKAVQYLKDMANGKLELETAGGQGSFKRFEEPPSEPEAGAEIVPPPRFKVPICQEIWTACLEKAKGKDQTPEEVLRAASGFIGDGCEEKFLTLDDLVRATRESKWHKTTLRKLDIPEKELPF